MRNILSMTGVIAGILFCNSAQATVISYLAPGVLVDPKAQNVVNFDNLVQASYGSTNRAGVFQQAGALFSGDGIIMKNGSDGSGSSLGMYAEPAHDHSNYLAIMDHDVENIKFDQQRSSFGLYWGSIDTYNFIRFENKGQQVAAFTGADIEIATPMPYGDQQSDASNRYVTFRSLPKYDSVVLGSGGNSLEVDNITSGIPEPSTWAMMLLGFGGLGLLGYRKSRKGEACATMIAA